MQEIVLGITFIQQMSVNVMSKYFTYSFTLLSLNSTRSPLHSPNWIRRVHFFCAGGAIPCHGWSGCSWIPYLFHKDQPSVMLFLLLHWGHGERLQSCHSHSGHLKLLCPLFLCLSYGGCQWSMAPGVYCNLLAPGTACTSLTSLWCSPALPWCTVTASWRLPFLPASPWSSPSLIPWLYFLFSVPSSKEEYCYNICFLFCFCYLLSLHYWFCYFPALCQFFSMAILYLFCDVLYSQLLI